MANVSRREGAERRIGLRAPVVLAATLLALLPVLIGWTGRALAQDDDDDEVDPGQALVRVVHASPDAGAVDVLIDDQPVVTDVAFGQASEFLAVPDDEINVKIVPAGSDADSDVIDEDVDVADGAAYEFVIANVLEDIEGRTYEINRDRLDDPNTARIRVIHLAPDAGEVDVFVSGEEDPLFEDVDFTDDSDYADVAAGTYDLEVRTGDDGTVALEAPGVAFEGGQVYDLLAIGQAADDSLQLLPLTTATLLPCGETFGLEAGADTACVRVVHVSPDAPNLDFYVDDGATPAVAALGVGSATTDWIALPAGDHEFRATPTGEPVADSTVALAEFDLEAGDAYDIVAIDNLDDMELQRVELDLSPLAGNQARLRLIHAVPDADDLDVAVAGGDVLFEDVEFMEETDYLELEATTYDLELRGDDDAVLFESPGVAFEPNFLYHLYAIGQEADQSLSLLSLPTPTIPGPTVAGDATPVAATPEATPVAEDDDGAEDAAETAEGAVDGTGTPEA